MYLRGDLKPVQPTGCDPWACCGSARGWQGRLVDLGDQRRHTSAAIHDGGSADRLGQLFLLPRDAVADEHDLEVGPGQGQLAQVSQPLSPLSSVSSTTTCGSTCARRRASGPVHVWCVPPSPAGGSGANSARTARNRCTPAPGAAEKSWAFPFERSLEFLSSPSPSGRLLHVGSCLLDQLYDTLFYNVVRPREKILKVLRLGDESCLQSRMQTLACGKPTGGNLWAWTDAQPQGGDPSSLHRVRWVT